MQRADKRKFHYVYRVDRFDGKFYIGMHSTDLMEDGYFGSGTRLSNSLRYHGKDKHVKTILEYFATRQEAKDYEKFLITDELRADKNCMNIAPGGGGGFINAEHHQKASSSGGLTSGHRYGKAIAEKYLTNEVRRKGHATQRKNGWTFTTKGLKFTDETKQLMSRSASGERNSQYATCWVCNDAGALKIKKEQLDEFIANGYRRGRK